MTPIFVIAIFFAGYVSRHILGIAFQKAFRKKMPDIFKDKSLSINGNEVSGVLMSFDSGKKWFVRSDTGWTQVNSDFIKKQIEYADNHKKPDIQPGYPTVS